MAPRPSHRSTGALVALLIAASALACDSRPTPEAKPSPAASAPPPPSPVPAAPPSPPQEVPPTTAQEAAEPPSPGRLDGAFLQGVIEHAGVERLELSVRADGTVDELEFYHQDAARIPAPVLARLEEVYPGAKILAYETELERGDAAPVYEVEVRTKDRKTCELEARADGSVVYTECVQATRGVSAEIQAILDKRLPGGKITEVEVTERPTGERSLEVKVEWKGQRHVLEFEGPEERMRRHAREVPATVAIEIP